MQKLNLQNFLKCARVQNTTKRNQKQKPKQRHLRKIISSRYNKRSKGKKKMING